MLLRVFKQRPNYNFMRRRWLGFIISGLLTAGALGLSVFHGLNFGIDFTGGVLIEARTQEAADLGKMREALSGHDLGEVSLQNFGEPRDVIIRIQTANGVEQAAVIARVKELLAAAGEANIEYRKIDYVGPTVGRELVRDGTLAVVLAFASIMCYMWFRFEWQYGLGGILALLHDSVMMIGFFAVTRFEFGLPALAAILTVVGYSINDSVVIYDRIRENMRRFKKLPVEELLNLSINETLARTVLTASTTLLAALSLALFGGEALKGFAWAIVIGVVVGTYSSVFISAPLLIYLNIRPQEEPDALPAKA